MDDMKNDYFLFFLKAVFVVIILGNNYWKFVLIDIFEKWGDKNTYGKWNEFYFNYPYKSVLLKYEIANLFKWNKFIEYFRCFSILTSCHRSSWKIFTSK